MATTRIELTEKAYMGVVAEITPSQAAELMQELSRYVAGGSAFPMRLTLTEAYGPGDKTFIGLRIAVGGSGWGPSDIRVESARLALPEGAI